MALRNRKPKGYWPHKPRYGRYASGQQLRKDVNKLKRQMREVELKFVDANVDDAVIAATGTVQSQLFTIPEGDGQSDRHGRKIVLKSVQWRGVVALPSSATIADGSDTCRLIMLKDNSANGALPAVLDILVAANWESFKNLENSGRFTTLLDKFVSINCFGVAGNGTSNDTAPREMGFKFYRKLNTMIEYNDSATTGVITTINTNNIVLLYISRNGVCSVESCIRFRYTDM